MRRGQRSPQVRCSDRRGAATVEFALTLPLFFLLLMGMVELGSALNSAQTLHGALRDAGRLASMDYKKFLGSSVDPNTKVITDIRNLLKASGLPGDAVAISIVHAEGAQVGQTFDLSDDTNYTKLFRIEASIPYAQVSSMPLRYMTGQNLTADVTFRMGKVSLAGP